MVSELARLGHRVDLLSYPQGAPVGIPGVAHRRSPRLPVGRVKAGASLAKLLLDVPFMLEAYALMASRRYDVVHAVEEAAHLAAPVARLLGLPLVADVDSSIPDQLRYSGFARRGPLPSLAASLERFALRNAAAVVTVCASLSDGVRRVAPAASVFQIEDPPLVDSPAGEAEGAALRSTLGLDPAPVVFYSGNFEAYQGVELLVDAAARVPEAQLVLMGGEAPEIEALRRRAASGGAEGRCVFVGKRPPADLPAFLSLATVLVSPRVAGANTPFKVYTYLASGRPLIATRVPSHTQVLDDSLCFLAEPTPPHLAATLREALSRPEEARRRARLGRELIEREYSPRRFADKVAAAYAHVEAVARR